MKLRGNVIARTELQKGVSKTTGKEWQTQSIVICQNPNDEYPKNIAIEFFGDKVGLLSGVQKGDVIEVSCNIESREHEGRWFTKVSGWKLEKANFNQPQAQPAFTPHAPTTVKQNEDNDDLPF